MSSLPSSQSPVFIGDNEPKPKKSQTKTLAAVTAVALSILLFVVSGEVLVRVYLNFHTFYDIEMSRYAVDVKEPSANPKIGHVHRPNMKAHLMNVDVSINSDGLRDREHPIAKEGKYRTAFLGDSLTFAWGVKEEDSFKNLLEQEFNKSRPSDILNFGTGNYNTEQEVNLFLEKGLKYSPDKVVVFYFINDAEPTRPKSPWSFLEHSRMLSFYWSRVQNLMGRWNPTQSFQQFYSRLYDDKLPGWNNLKTAFTQLSQVCREKGIELQVVLLPELHNLKDYPFQREHQMVADHLKSLNVAYLDIFPAFQNYPNPMDLWVSLDDAHPNAKAHAMIAKASADFIRPTSLRR